MARTKTDWSHHVAAFRASSQTVSAYCADIGIKPDTFRYHLYKAKLKKDKPKRFQEYQVASELVVTRDPRGSITLSGFDVAQLPQIIGAWSNALS